MYITNYTCQTQLMKSTTNILAIIAIITTIGLYFQDRKSTGTSKDSFWSLKGSPCNPKTNIVFVKVHKCASSTLSNIFQRFGEKHHLKFLLPEDNCYLGGYPEPFKILPGYRGHKYNMMVNHMVFNKQPIRELMPEDTVYIGVVRHPVSHLQSIYNYFKLWERGLPALDQFEQNPILFYGGAKTDLAKTQVKNFQSFHYKLAASANPKATEVERFVKTIDRQFDFVIVADHLKESLLLLKDFLCWSMEDILFVSHKVRNKDSISGEHHIDLKLVERNIQKWSLADFALFEHFNKTLWNKIANIDPDMFENQLNEYNNQLEIVRETCSKYGLSTKNNYENKATLNENNSTEHEESEFSRCSLMYLNPVQYVQRLKLLDSINT
ncbi:unnamed protein product [Owenia fusiformis]|uniref:Uncharacterized protein n=1 Tax=Owenia fusiformis TaxID=6347 RepID=A0A8J1U4S8_OWEFU|nr:unnamed protein product [Owenia fusiformis]